jgi:hypothetical protein
MQRKGVYTMTTEDLVARYMSDTKALHLLYDVGKIDRSQLDSAIENLDNKLFTEFGFMPATEESIVDRIGAYSL